MKKYYGPGIGFIAALSTMIGLYSTSPEVDWSRRGSPEQFGQFGDYIGGILNPIFGFCTVILLLLTLKVQRETLKNANLQLEATKEELKLSTAALKENSRIQSEQLFRDEEARTRQQLESASNMHLEEIERLLGKIFFEYHYHRPADGNECWQSCSINTLLDQVLPPSDQLKAIEQVVARIPHSDTREQQHLRELELNFNLAANSIIELKNYLPFRSSLRKYWATKIIRPLLLCENLPFFKPHKIDELLAKLKAEFPDHF